MILTPSLKPNRHPGKTRDKVTRHPFQVAANLDITHPAKHFRENRVDLESREPLTQANVMSATERKVFVR
jgi:hypothetical protein